VAIDQLLDEEEKTKRENLRISDLEKAASIEELEPEPNVTAIQVARRRARPYKIRKAARASRLGSAAFSFSKKSVPNCLEFKLQLASERRTA